MEIMKTADALKLADENGVILFGGKAAGRKNPKKTLVPVKIELLPRGVVRLVHAATGELVEQTRTGTPFFAGPLADILDADLPEIAPIPEGFEIGDRWTVTNKAGEEIGQVDGVTMEDARKAAEKLPKVRRTAKAEGGFSLRRMLVEKAPEAPAEEPAEAHEEKLTGKPGKAPENFVYMAKHASTEAARRYWGRLVAEYEG